MNAMGAEGLTSTPVEIATAPYRPLVAAATRTGLTLLVSITRQFIPLAPHYRVPERTRLLRKLCRHLGQYVHERMMRPIRAAGLESRLLYNGMFHPLAGGTKWLKDDRVDVACIRKYIGIKGMGDFTLITSHPREVLETDDVIHSHEDPRRWFRDDHYLGCTRYAAVRHPVGTINSAMFSINALTSEYIQRYLPPSEDNDLVRQDIAKYKLTDLDFFRSVLKYYAGYLRAFLEVRERFTLMRWEDLIQAPVPTILALGHASAIPLGRGQAESIWKQLDHVNLTGPHQHNYRRGKGIVDDWKNWLVNEHLEVIREFDFAPALRELGYGPIESLDPRHYTPFQKEIAALIGRGQIYRDFRDPELFNFSVQKSNVDWRDLKGFRGYEWRAHTQIERSCLTDPDLELRVWDAAETAVGRANSLLRDFLNIETDTKGRLAVDTARLMLKHGWSWFPVYLKHIMEHRRGVRAASAQRKMPA
jgi:hypothetical protein